jgi:diguanylate cyclase (GGDEF)-like protein/PAS domain S-box-containing protein
MTAVERKVSVGFFGALAVLGALALATYLETADFIGRSRELSHIHTVLGKLDQVFLHVAAAQTKQQAFVRAGSKQDLDACQQALFSIDQLVGEIRGLSARQSGQLQRLEQLGPLVATQVKLVEDTVRRRQIAGPTAATRYFKAHLSDQSMAGLGRLLADFKDHETELMVTQNQDFERKTHVIMRFLTTGILVSLLIFAYVNRIIRQEMARRHEAERNLQRQTKTLASVLRNIGDAIVVYDAEGRLSVSNPAAERFFGELAPQLTRDSRQGEAALLLEDRSRQLAYDELPVVRALWGEDCDDLVVCLKRAKDGRFFYLSATSRGFRDADGLLSGAMVAYHDVTEQKNEQLALHGANLGLEERVNALKQAQQELQDVSVRDPLTGLYNRRQLDLIFAEELERARRSGIALGVLMMDIDFFKKFNDSFGHDAGDLVLKQVAAAVHGSLRAADSLFRFGGEEFTLLLPGADLRESQQVAEKARLAVEALQLTHQGRSLGKLSISLGVASFPQTGQGSAELLKQADEALYDAKHGGRNRSSLWQPPAKNAA